MLKSPRVLTARISYHNPATHKDHEVLSLSNADKTLGPVFLFHLLLSIKQIKSAYEYTTARRNVYISVYLTALWEGGATRTTSLSVSPVTIFQTFHGCRR